MLGPHTYRDNPLSRIMCAPIDPPCHSVLHYENLTTFLFSGNCFSIPGKMKKRNEKTNTGEGDKVKRDRTVSDDVGGESLSDTSTSTCGHCVGESSTGRTNDGLKTIILSSSSESDDVVFLTPRTTRGRLSIICQVQNT